MGERGKWKQEGEGKQEEEGKWEEEGREIIGYREIVQELPTCMFFHRESYWTNHSISWADQERYASVPKKWRKLKSYTNK